MDRIILNNGIEIPNLCYGTGITSIYSTGIKRKLKIAQNKLNILLNKNKKMR